MGLVDFVAGVGGSWWFCGGVLVLWWFGTVSFVWVVNEVVLVVFVVNKMVWLRGKEGNWNPKGGGGNHETGILGN